MGCHTWFRNKIADMPNEHLERLRKVHIRNIKNAYIYKCSPDQWVKNGEEELNIFLEDYSEAEIKESELLRMELKMIKKSMTREYYDRHRTKYVKDLETLKNPKATRNQLLKVFSRHDLSFDKDFKNGSYEMSKVGWHNNYRVSGYPSVVHHNAEEAVKWLEEYDNGRNIQCNLTKGMCQEIRDILTEFFTKFPNGTIHYG